MTKLKRPERYVNFESIKPELREITEFYTRKVKDYQYRLKQLNEYADELENEILVLKETPKIEVLLDDMPKPLVVVPQIIAEWLDNKGTYIIATSPIPKEVLMWSQENTGFRDVAVNLSNLIEIKVNGYTVEKPQLFYLNNKIKLEDVGSDLIGYLNLFLTNNGYLTSNINRAKKFTQQEIDSMQTGSYEQIEVEP